MIQNPNDMSDMELLIAADGIVRELQEREPISATDYERIPVEYANKCVIAEVIVRAWNRYIYGNTDPNATERTLRRFAGYYITLVRR